MNNPTVSNFKRAAQHCKGGRETRPPQISEELPNGAVKRRPIQTCGKTPHHYHWLENQNIQICIFKNPGKNGGTFTYCMWASPALCLAVINELLKGVGKTPTPSKPTTEGYSHE